jgi:hypothetical protein
MLLWILSLWRIVAVEVSRTYTQVKKDNIGELKTDLICLEIRGEEISSQSSSSGIAFILADLQYFRAATWEATPSLMFHHTPRVMVSS